MTDQHRLHVLQSAQRPVPQTNPYVVQLGAALPGAGVDCTWFTWRQAIRGRYDVLHVHWPEVMLRRRSRAARWACRARFVLLLGRLALRRRTAVVRTVHNSAPHEPGGVAERALLRALDRRTTWWITMNTSSPVPDRARSTLILHGDYRSWFAGHPNGPAVPGRLCFFGQVRRYKRVDTLLEAFGATQDPSLSLHVAGKPSSVELEGRLRDLGARDPRVTLRLEFVPDDDLAGEVSAAELVVLPYDDFLNSGALLLALSLGRPTLVPRTPVTEELAREVGEDWVLTYDGPLTGAVLTEAVERLRRCDRSAAPDLHRREWATVAAQHAACYARAVRQLTPAVDPSR